MTIRNTDYREWRFCPTCGLTLIESRLLIQDRDDGFTSFAVACKNGHQYVLTSDSRRHEVILRAWEGAVR
jgi:hypothetical protein